MAKRDAAKKPATTGKREPSTGAPVIHRKGRVIRPDRRCVAHSSRDGAPCGNPAMKGQNVCRFHGGATTTAKARAQERILAAADLGARQLIAFMTSNKVPYNVRLQAARDLLDRAGLAASQKVDITAKWQQDVDEVMSIWEGEVEEDESEEDGPAVQYPNEERALPAASAADDEMFTPPSAQTTAREIKLDPPRRTRRTREDKLTGDDG